VRDDGIFASRSHGGLSSYGSPGERSSSAFSDHGDSMLHQAGHAALLPRAAVPTSAGTWKSLGCYTFVFFFFETFLLKNSSKVFSDSVSARVLNATMVQLSDQTIETCTSACQTAGYVSGISCSWDQGPDSSHSPWLGLNTR
jgi:hypothetical protein